jgi:hypothetical protein
MPPEPSLDPFCIQTRVIAGRPVSLPVVEVRSGGSTNVTQPRRNCAGPDPPPPSRWHARGFYCHLRDMRSRRDGRPGSPSARNGMARRFGCGYGGLRLRLHPGNSPRRKLCWSSIHQAHRWHRASRRRNRGCCPAAWRIHRCPVSSSDVTHPVSEFESCRRRLP